MEDRQKRIDRERIENLFEAALERPLGARRSWVEEACDGDAGLCSEVLSLLAAHERAEGVLEHPPASLPETSAADRIGQKVGAYRLLREIGRGGMGAVYLAERADGQFDQRVAIKILRDETNAQETVRRFLAERQIVASLHHPGIAALYDGGVTDGGRPYFVMEYVQGQPIDRYCEERRLDLHQRLYLMVAVGEALQYAHRNLIIHRDVKPANILVTDDGRVKLLDFGIAKLLDPEGVGLTAGPRTRTGLRLMTPEYASPEQVRSEPVTTATDVYGLGLVLYELLAGRPPYRLAGRTPSEIEHVICEETPEPPSTAGIAGDAGDLDTICMKALRKEPERRYGSAAAFTRDIERYLSGQPISARPDTFRYRGGKFVRRHRWGVASAALVLLALVAGLVGTTWQAQRAIEQAEAAERERDKAEQVTSFMMNLFEASDPSAALGDTITARRLLARGVARIEELDDQPAVQAQMLDVVGQVYQSLGRYDRAKPLLEQALAVRRAHFGEAHVEVAESLNDLASLLHDQGAYDEAEPLYREAIALRSRLLGMQDPQVAEALNNLALVVLRKGDDEEAESLYRKSLAIHRENEEESRLALVPSLSGLATVLQGRGEYDAAEPLFREALAVSRSELDERHPTIATTLNNLGLLLVRKSEYAEAEECLREALAMRRALFGDEHPRLATTLNNLASALHRRQEYAEAEPLFRKSLKINRKLLGENHPRVAAGKDNLGELLRDTGRYAEAEVMLEQALATFRMTVSDDHPYMRRTIEDLVALYDAWDKPRQAERYRTMLAEAR